MSTRTQKCPRGGRGRRGGARRTVAPPGEQAAHPQHGKRVEHHQRQGRRRAALVGDDRQLDMYDVSGLARDTGNRIMVAVRSTNGVGGLIAAVDIKPEIENLIVTGADWSEAGAGRGKDLQERSGGR